MAVNTESNKRISEGNKWLEVLGEKKYLEFGQIEKAALKIYYSKLREEVKSYQSPNTSLLGVFNELTQTLDSMEGFFWVSVAE